MVSMAVAETSSRGTGRVRWRAGTGPAAGASSSRRPSARSRRRPLPSAGSGVACCAPQVDIGGGRKMYLECRGAGSPTVVLVSGLDAAADLRHRDEQPAPKVFPKVAELTRVCAYDRSGTPYGPGLPSRSDPVAQPITPKGSVEDLHALLRAAHAPGHPTSSSGTLYGGLVPRLFASTDPKGYGLSQSAPTTPNFGP